ncbi:MAG: hypothetical protein FWE85_02635 [Clostridiales bacterium]|nr:hypothetical protein [Clostridiales bacterium]
MLKYIKNNVWDYSLCILMISGLGINFFQIFFLPAHLQANVWAAALAASLLCLIFFACAYSNRSIVFSLIVFVIAVALGVMYVQATGFLAGMGENAEANAPAFGLILAFLSLLVFLLSRTRAGAVILAVLGSIAICAVVFLEYEHYFWGYLVFIGASLCMCYYRNYRHNIIHTNTVKVSFSRFASISSAAVGLVLILSIVVSVTLIQPLNLPTLELKLITRHLSLEVLEQSASSSKVIMPDVEQKSSETDNTTTTSKNPGEEDMEKTEYQEVAPTLQDKDTFTLNHSNMENFLYAIRYVLSEIPPFFLIAVPFLIILLAVFTKKGLRRRWYYKTLLKDKKQQVIDFYLYYLKKFEVLSYRRPLADTPIEFAGKLKDKLRVFSVDDADITSLTNVFIKANYGRLDVSDEEYSLFLKFHKAFYKNCKAKLGTVKYLRKFFAL